MILLKLTSNNSWEIFRSTFYTSIHFPGHNNIVKCTSKDFPRIIITFLSFSHPRRALPRPPRPPHNGPLTTQTSKMVSLWYFDKGNCIHFDQFQKLIFPPTARPRPPIRPAAPNRLGILPRMNGNNILQGNITVHCSQHEYELYFWFITSFQFKINKILIAQLNCDL